MTILVSAKGRVVDHVEDVSTKRLTLGSLAAAFAAIKAPEITAGITLFGLESHDTTDATWTKAETPVADM